MPEEIRVEKRGTIVDAELPERSIFIRAERIRETSSLVKAEISISIGEKGSRVLLNRGRISMLEDAPKTRLIDLLIEKAASIGYSDPEDDGFWGNVIDESFYAIVDKFREGNKAETMDNLASSPPRTYAISPIITKGVANLMWAPGGSYKSYFGLLTCVMVDRGLDFLDMHARKGNALYLDWEEDSDVFKNRLLAIQRGLVLPNPETSGIIRKEMAAEKLSTSIEELSKLIHDNDITYVCIDSLNPALAGNSVDSDAIEEYFASLRQLGVTSLSLDHANRSGEKSGNWSIHGSAFKYNRSRQVYEVKKVQVPNSQVSQFGLYHRKSNDSALATPRIFEVEFENRSEFNSKEDRYDDVLYKVTFRKKKLREASGEFMRAMEIPEIAHELVKEQGSLNIMTLAANVAETKGVSVTPASLKASLNGSSGLVIDGNSVTLATQQQTDNESLKTELQRLGARVVSTQPLEPCPRCDEMEWNKDERGLYCLHCGFGSK